MFGRRRQPVAAAAGELAEARRTVTVWQPDPLVRATTRALDSRIVADLSGRAGAPTHIGFDADRSRRFSGEAGMLQVFIGASLPGTAYDLVRPGFNRALPNTAGPVGDGNDPGAAAQRARWATGALGGRSRR